jgi:hypothetical protein
MTALLGKDGTSYDIPPENVDKAVASGQFSLPATPEAAPGLPATAAPPAAATGPDVASLAAGATPEQVAQSEKETHAHDAPDIQDVPLIGEDGKLYNIPDANVAAAVATGKFRVSTLEERNASEDQRINAKFAADTGPLEAGALGFARHLPLVDVAASGIAGALSGKTTREELAQSQRDADLVSEAHPVAYGAGAVGGEVAGAVGLGAVGEGLTGAVGLGRAAQAGDLLTSGVGRGVAKAAIEGAVYSAEPVAKAIVNKDPAGSAEALALGIGLNVALHGAFAGIAKLPGLAAEGTEKLGSAVKDKLAPELSTVESGNYFGRQIGLTTKQIADNRGEILPLIKATGIVSTDTTKQALAKIQALEESGPAIGRAIKALDSFDGKAPVIEEHLANATDELRRLIPQEALDREAVEAAYESGKKELRRIALADKPNPIRLGLAKNQLETAERALLDMPELSSDAEQALKTMRPILSRVEASATRGTFADTQAMKKFIGDQTNFTDNKFANGLRRQAYGIIAENVARAEDAAAGELGSTEVVEGLRQQRGAYALHKIFGDAADKVEARAGAEHLGHLLGGPSTGSGHMLPHFVLGAFGLPSGLNAALAITGVPQMVKGYVAKQRMSGAIAKLLNESTAPATNTVVHALERQKLQLSEGVRSFFSALGTREAEKPLDTTGGLRGFVEDANGRSHGQQLASLKRAITEAHLDPTVAAARLEHVVAPLHAEGLHEVAQAYTDHQLRLMKVLQAILPGDSNSIAHAHPFAAKVNEDEIAPATKARYQRALTIAADPQALLHLVKNNQINQGDVAIAAAVNPSTLQKLRDEVIREGMKSKPDLTYQQRLSMGILLGQNIDQSTEQIPQLQSVYAGAAAPASAPAGSHHHSGHLSGGAQKNLTNAPLTLSQQAGGHSR